MTGVILTSPSFVGLFSLLDNSAVSKLNSNNNIFIVLNLYLKIDPRCIIQKNQNSKSFNRTHSSCQCHGERLGKTRNQGWICLCKEIGFQLHSEWGERNG